MKKNNILKIVVLILIGAIILFSLQSLTAKPSIESIIPQAEIRAKIEKNVQVEIQDNYLNEKNITILIKGKDNLDKISEAIKDNGKIKGKYELGDIIVAEVPVNKISEIAKNSETIGIWSNRIYHIDLNESVPQINAQSMWARGYNGTGIKIAIIDTGIDKNHEMFNGRVIKEKDFSSDNNTMDLNGHGTHVAGIAAGNGLLKGVAPGALLINAKAISSDGYGTDENIIAAINWAVDPDGDKLTDDGADIISMSLGGSYSDLNSPLVDTVREVINKGINVVVASGNCGKGCPSSGCNGFIGVETPGITPEAITVGAVDKSNNWACFSSGGIINNSGEIIIKPDVVAAGVNILSSEPNNQYVSLSGTSMATPHVAGAVALLLQANPNLIPSQVKEIIERTAEHLGEPGKDIKYGSGLIDAESYYPSNVENILKYQLSFQEVVYQNDMIKITLNDTFDDTISAYATILNPLNDQFVMNLTKTLPKIWQASFTNTSIIGTYSLNITIKNREEKYITLKNNFDVISYNLTNGIIREISIPSQVSYGDSLPMSMLFENTGNSPLDVMIEAQIWDDNLIASIKNESRVNPNSFKTFNLTWNAISAGIKTLKVIASYSEAYYSLSRIFDVVDNSSPLVLSVEYKNTTKRNPLVVDFVIDDLSEIYGYMYIKQGATIINKTALKELYRINNNHTLTGTFIETNPGTYSFFLELCDLNYCSNSTSYSFVITDCTYPYLLLVGETAQEFAIFENALNNYCLARWNIQKSGVPTLSYIESFPALIWATGFFSKNIDEQEANLLESYINNKGKLVLEGAGIAFRHGYDTFMLNVTKSRIDRNLVNETNLVIIKNIDHPILKNIADNFIFNITTCPYPDSVIPVNGTSLASWDRANSSLIIYEENEKVLFIPFSLAALDSVANQLITNIGDWLLTSDNNPDFIVTNLSYDYLVAGANPIYVNVTNIGNKGATNIQVAVYVDGVKKAYTTIDLNINQTRRVLLSPSASAGVHEIKIMANPDFTIKEKNYINNALIRKLSYATTQADLTVEKVTYQTNENLLTIFPYIKNIGGSAATVDVEFWINDILNDTKKILIDAGRTVIVNSTSQKASGTYNLVVKINPQHTVIESNYTNNEINSSIYICNKFNVLIIADDDTESRVGNSTDNADFITDILNKNGYCTSIWDESSQGTPKIDYLNNFDVVVWSSGNYWNVAINETDIELLNQYKGNIIYEGSDIAFDHINDSFMQNKLHAILVKDLMILNNTQLELKQHKILDGITNITLNASMCPFPDTVITIDSDSVANLPNGNSMIVAYNKTRNRVVYFTFAISCIQENTRENLIKNSIEFVYILRGDVNLDDKVDIFDLASVGLSYGTKPGDQYWNENADLNNDKEINIFDLATVGLNYGRYK